LAVESKECGGRSKKQKQSTRIVINERSQQCDDENERAEREKGEKRHEKRGAESRDRGGLENCRLAKFLW
jgi:hypothetical protein